MGIIGNSAERGPAMSKRKERREERRALALNDVYEYGESIVSTDIYKKAMVQTHHRKTTVGDHSESVAVTALRMCRKIGRISIYSDEKQVVMAALAHDLGIVGRHEKYSNEITTVLHHPEDSAKIAREMLPGMGNKFYDSISRHMFPITFLPPTSIEGVIVSLADKVVSVKELVKGYA